MGVPGSEARRHEIPLDLTVTTGKASEYDGGDRGRPATRWRSAGICRPRVRRIPVDRFHPFIPRGTERFGLLYRRRTSAERKFADAKTQWAAGEIRVRGLDRVRLHARLFQLTYILYELAVLTPVS